MSYLDVLHVGLPVLDFPAVIAGEKEVFIVGPYHGTDGGIVGLRGGILAGLLGRGSFPSNSDGGQRTRRETTDWRTEKGGRREPKDRWPFEPLLPSKTSTAGEKGKHRPWRRVARDTAEANGRRRTARRRCSVAPTPPVLSQPPSLLRHLKMRRHGEEGGHLDNRLKVEAGAVPERELPAVGASHEAAAVRHPQDHVDGAAHLWEDTAGGGG